MCVHQYISRQKKPTTQPALNVLDVLPWCRSVVSMKPDMGYHPQENMDIYKEVVLIIADQPDTLQTIKFFAG